MTPVASLRSGGTVQEHTKESPVSVATLTRRGVLVEGVTRSPVHLSTRSSVSVSHRDVIFASVFSSVGFIVLVALVIVLVQYWMRHRDTSEDMIIERPSQTFQERQDTVSYQNAPFQNAPVSITPPTVETPDRAYIPNHPYASSYTRDSNNSSPPGLLSNNVVQPPTQHSPFPSTALSHPYTHTSPPRRHERVPSADPSTIYESFMSPDSPVPSPPPFIEPTQPSPLASTVGGVISNHHRSQFDALLSAALSDEAPSTMSASSSTPLRPPGEKHPRR